MSDRNVTLEEAKASVQRFCEARDWDRFNPPKDLAIGIVTEASELLDLFRFKRPEDIERMLYDEEGRERVSEELADTFFFLLRFAQMNDFDLSDCLADKIEKNGKKYPEDLARGRNLTAAELASLEKE